jgi:ribosomal protein S17
MGTRCNDKGGEYVKHTLRILIAAGLVAAGVAACNSEKPKTETPQQAAAPAPVTPGAGGTGEMPAGHPPLGEKAAAGAPAGTAPAGKIFSGTVVDTMNASNYTYVQVDNGKEKIWAAAPQFDVKKGDKVNVPEGMPMKDYKSEALKRTFDTVYFVGAIGKGDQMPAAAGEQMGAAAPQSGQPMPEGLHPKVDASQAAKDANVTFSGIKKAEKTVADVFAGQAALSGKEVSIRGKVVKFNAMIMGKNWIHLQDGSGATGTNDLTITTDTDAKVGDTVLVQGKVTLNKDFGMGYKYGVIIEDAKVKVE